MNCEQSKEKQFYVAELWTITDDTFGITIISKNNDDENVRAYNVEVKINKRGELVGFSSEIIKGEKNV